LTHRGDPGGILDGLRVSEDGWRALFDSGWIGIALRDAGARLLDCNDAYATMHGSTPEQLIGTDYTGVYAAADAAQATADHAKRWLHGEGDLDVERPCVLRDGRTVFLSGIISVVRGPDGTPSHQLALVINRTEEKLAEEELERVRRAEAIGRLAGGVAHDFNNMLAVIIGHAEIVAGRLGDSHPLAHELTEVRAAADRCRILAAELLAFGRQQVLERRAFAPGEVVAGLTELLHEAMPPTVELVVEDSSQGSAVLGDRAQLEAVIVSLATNARDAMPAGGRLTIRTAVTSGSGDDAGSVTISATDTGIGMTDEIRERIFDPYFTTKELGHGSGLGLATVAGIVEQMGGRVTVESVPGRGSAFTVELPCHAPDHAPAAGQLSASGVAGTHGGDAAGPGAGEPDFDTTSRILVVEDQPQVRRLVERLLERAGYLVLSAEDGTAALELLRDPVEEIDLLLTDMILPDLHGGDLAREAVALRPGLRVLYTSGYAGESVARDGMPPGDGFLQKPYKPERLEAALREALATR
jgi:two-component system, cell cycle sensor histidine kinase and response regulator CckA